MIKGGIYQDIQFKSMYLIPLEFCKNGKIFGVIIDSEETSNNKIQVNISDILISGKISTYDFWYIKNEDLLMQIDGYLGKLDVCVYNQLCKELHKQFIWKEKLKG